MTDKKNCMETKYLKLNLKDILPNPKNPRTIDKKQFEALKTSIIKSPKLLEVSPLVINEEFIVLGGNMRLKALKELGVEETHCIQVIGMTPEKQQELIIKDNLNYGDWDWNVLLDWDKESLKDFGLHAPRFFVDETEERERDVDTLSADFETWLNNDKIDLKLFYEPETYNLVIGYFNDQGGTEKSKVVLSLINKYFEENNLLKDRR